MNMTEWDKMQEHQIYNDFDADLFDLRVEAKKLFKVKQKSCLKSLTVPRTKKPNVVRTSCEGSSKK